MAEFFAGAALAILAATGLALFAVLRRRSALDAMMAVQLVGTGGAAVRAAAVRRRWRRRRCWTSP